MKIDLDLVSEDKKVVGQLEEFVGELINGADPRTAIAQVWPRAASYVSDVNGALVGWDMCGGCNRHVSRCTEEGGPSEPAYFQRLRAEDAKRKAVAAGASTAEAEMGLGARTSVPSAAPAPAAQSADAESSTSVVAGVPCKVGEHFVAEQDADRNDDGTWTCHEHQAGAAQRG